MGGNSGSHAEDLFPREWDITFSYISSRENFIGQGGTEDAAQECIVKVANAAPEAAVTVAAFGDEAVDMWVPFEVSAKGMENHDKAGGEVHGLILLEKHT